MQRHGANNRMETACNSEEREKCGESAHLMGRSEYVPADEPSDKIGGPGPGLGNSVGVPLGLVYE